MMKTSALAGALFAFGMAGAGWAQDMDPTTMTCADIAGMEEGRAEGAIYFLAGHEYAMGAGMTGVTGTAAQTDSTATGTTGGTSGTAATPLAGTGTDGGAMGFEQIDVAAVMRACEDAPESLLSTVIRDSAGN